MPPKPSLKRPSTSSFDTPAPADLTAGEPRIDVAVEITVFPRSTFTEVPGHLPTLDDIDRHPPVFHEDTPVEAWRYKRTIDAYGDDPLATHRRCRRKVTS